MKLWKVDNEKLVEVNKSRPDKMVENIYKGRS